MLTCAKPVRDKRKEKERKGISWKGIAFEAASPTLFLLVCIIFGR
jgi:hypothetical protein